MEKEKGTPTNRLTSIEGQRVISILDDCVQKLSFITLFKKELLGSVESLHSALGSDAHLFIVCTFITSSNFSNIVVVVVTKRCHCKT